MQILQMDKKTSIQADTYQVCYRSDQPSLLRIRFKNGVGGDFQVVSGCDRDEGIDELIELQPPKIVEKNNCVRLTYNARTTLWDSVEYEFVCYPDKICYRYTVNGDGRLDNARFFEGFLASDPRMQAAGYPYFCGPGRHKSFHRPVKDFMQSSTPAFDRLYSFSINSSDKREFMYYEDSVIRANGDRWYNGGDWLATPPPFLYLIGNREAKGWVSLGLVVRPEEANFKGYEYSGGEGFGLNLTYDGMVEIEDQWSSPQIVLQACSQDVYEGLEQHVTHLAECGALPPKDRSNQPSWWSKPIFGGWGEQVFHSNRWDMYFSGNHDDWKDDNVDALCTQTAYEEMLARLETKGVDPTILIIDNRWFDLNSHLKVDNELWPDLKGFIADQHAKQTDLFEDSEAAETLADSIQSEEPSCESLDRPLPVTCPHCSSASVHLNAELRRGSIRSP